jgi:hypothetical protein
MQSVIAHTDPEPDRDVIKHGRHGEGLPAEHEQGGNGPDVQEHQKICGEPVKPLALGQFGGVYSLHEFPSRNKDPLLN